MLSIMNAWMSELYKLLLSVAVIPPEWRQNSRLSPVVCLLQHLYMMGAKLFFN